MGRRGDARGAAWRRLGRRLDWRLDRVLDRVLDRCLQRVMDRRCALAPKVRGAGRMVRFVARDWLAAKGDELLTRTEPIAGEAHDLRGRLTGVVSLVLPTFPHRVAGLFQLFLLRRRRRRPDSAVL